MATRTPIAQSNQRRAPRRGWLISLLAHRGVQAALALWALGHAAVLLLTNGSLPFDRPALAGVPFAIQLASPTMGMLEIFVLMGLVYALTRSRAVPDIAVRAPERALAWRETAGLLAYAAIGQAAGWVLGPALGFKPFSFHLAGTLVGGHAGLSVAETLSWAAYNFAVYAAAPYLWFRRRYAAAQLNMVSTDRRNDLLVIAVIALAEALFELAVLSSGIAGLSPRQFALGLPLTFVIYGLGTVLPTMVLIYAILVPRYLKLSGSATTTVLLGGLTYAALHLVEGWSNFSTPANALLSLIFVLLNYFGPGMIKTVLTLRTGNAWVHALGYHAVAPHVVIDTPHIVGIFGIR